MKILYDKEAMRSWGDLKRTDEIRFKSSDDIEKNIKKELILIGRWMKADRVIFYSYHKGQACYIIKGKKMLIIQAFGNQLDGGWNSFKEVPIPKEFLDKTYYPKSVRKTNYDITKRI